MTVIVQAAMGYPLVDGRSGFPCFGTCVQQGSTVVAVVAPSVPVDLEAFLDRLPVGLLVPHSSQILSVGFSILLMRLELILLSKLATCLVEVLAEAVEAFDLVHVPKYPDGTEDLVQGSLELKHLPSVAVQA